MCPMRARSFTFSSNEEQELVLDFTFHFESEINYKMCRLHQCNTLVPRSNICANKESFFDHQLTFWMHTLLAICLFRDILIQAKIF